MLWGLNNPIKHFHSDVHHCQCNPNHKYKIHKIGEIKMKISSIVLIIGSSLMGLALIGGGIISYLSWATIVKDPIEEAEYTIEHPGNISMEKGDYEIWIRLGVTDLSDISIKITDSINESVPIKKSDEKIKMEEKFVLYGSFNIRNNGVYNISGSNDVTLYITPPLKVLENFGTACMVCFVTIIGFIVGLIVLIVGIVLHVRAKKRDRSPEGKKDKTYKKGGKNKRATPDWKNVRPEDVDKD